MAETRQTVLEDGAETLHHVQASRLDFGEVREQLGFELVAAPVKPSDSSTVSNMAAALAQDSRYPQLVAELRAAIADGRLSTHDKKSLGVFRAIYDQVMPREVGTHDSVNNDDPNRKDDLVDRVVAELK